MERNHLNLIVVCFYLFTNQIGTIKKFRNEQQISHDPPKIKFFTSTPTPTIPTHYKTIEITIKRNSQAMRIRKL